MLTGIDHIVILVSDLETAIRNYKQLGFTVAPGGRHPTSTHNALIGFADGAYLELLAFYQPNPESKWWVKLEQGGGLIDFCLQTDNLLSEIAAFREAGIPMSDPKPLSRVRPDGYQLSWMLSTYSGQDQGGVGFLIEDETPREERVPKETQHENQVTGIGAMTIAVNDIATIRRWYASLLRDDGQEIEREDLDAAGVRFSIGPHSFDFVAPKGSAGPLSDWLRDRGPSPYAATFVTASGKKGPLDEAKTLGAHLSLV
ncbi:MAG: VOC family protein [Blastocatellia bacterium]